MATIGDQYGVRSTLTSSSAETFTYFSLEKLAAQGVTGVDRAPFIVKVMLENLLRTGAGVEREDLQALAEFTQHAGDKREFPFSPARVVLQDFTGVPVGLISPRCACGGATRRRPAADQSARADRSGRRPLGAGGHVGTTAAFKGNVAREYERNHEVHAAPLGAGAFHNFRVVPPGTGIVHQGEPRVPGPRRADGARGLADVSPDTLVGTDSPPP
ncbi:MAG: aconitase family protein [Chloroflexia bacterium]